MKRLPFGTLALTALTLAIHVHPAGVDFLQFDREAVSQGQGWRFFTAHFTHFGPDHLRWDLLGFLVLGTLAERISRPGLLGLLTVSGIVITSGIWLVQPQFAIYRGLSGLDSALFGWVIAELLITGRRERHFPTQALAALGLAGFAGKCLYELRTGGTVFVSPAPAVFAPVPLAHLLGFLVGCAWPLLTQIFRVFRRFPRQSSPFSLSMRFYKYHALGNDYIVLNPADFPQWTPAPTIDQIRVVCHRNFGVGSDGILWGPLPSSQSEFGLRIFNPDGSEAEKSGNGLRIFSRYLWDEKLAKNATFTIETPGGHVQSVIKEDGKLITVDMGSVSFTSTKIPHVGPEREVINEQITVLDRTFTYCSATIGNPHCVLPLPEISAEIAHKYGPHLETHPNFPRKTNVQFLKVLDRQNIQIEIWERGAGYTLASGSSSSAAAAVARKLGLVDPHLTVHMPGGKIGIEIGDNYAIRMTGSVNKVAVGDMHPDLFEVKV